MSGQVWYTVPPITPATHRCTCWQPRPTRIRRPRNLYPLRNERPVFLKSSEIEDYTPEELTDLRKSWAKP